MKNEFEVFLNNFLYNRERYNFPKDYFKNQYHEYLKTDKWQRLAARAKKRSRGKCDICGVREDIEVHHLTYERIFQEKLEDLLVVCGGCHDLLVQYVTPLNYWGKR